MLPNPGIHEQVFHTHPCLETMAGPTEYWNHKAIAIAIVNKRENRAIMLVIFILVIYTIYTTSIILKFLFFLI